MIGIYKITNPKKSIYIGQSKDIEKRFNTYKKLNCKSQIKLYNSFLKYGVENHIFEIIHICSIDELNDNERYYQDLFCSINRAGLNLKLTKSSDRKCEHSEETKIKIGKASASRSPETLLKLSNAIKKREYKESTRQKHIIAGYKRVQSEQSKKKMSEFMKKNLTDEWRSKINSAISRKVIDTSTGIIYESIASAARLNNINRKTLTSWIYGLRKNNSSFMYYDEMKRAM